MEKIKKLSHNIDHIPNYDLERQNYLYKFKCLHFLDNVDDISSMSSMSYNDFKELIIEQLATEFKHELNDIMFGHPTGRLYMEDIEYDKYDKETVIQYLIDILSLDITSGIWKSENDICKLYPSITKDILRLFIDNHPKIFLRNEYNLITSKSLYLKHTKLWVKLLNLIKIKI